MKQQKRLQRMFAVLMIFAMVIMTITPTFLVVKADATASSILKRVLVLAANDSGNVDLSKYEDDKALTELIEASVEKAKEYVNQVCGVIKDGDWSTTTDFYLEQSDTMDLINRAQMAVADKYLKEAGLNKVMMSSTCVVVNENYTVQPGEIFLKDIYTMYRYENYLYIVLLKGKEIRTWLEGNAEENFSVTLEDRIAKFGLGKNKFTNPVFYGIDFQNNLANEPGNRIKRLKFADGSEVKENETSDVHGVLVDTSSKDYQYRLARIADEVNDTRNDAVVLLTHAGAEQIAGQLNKDTEVDLVLGGHTHQDGFGKAENGVPYLQPQNAAKSYAYAEICVDSKTKEISVDDQKVVNIYKEKDRLYNTEENKDNLDSKIVEISNLAVKEVEPVLNEELGYVTTSITKSVIPGPLTSVAGTWMSDMANRATGSKVSFTNAGGIRTEFLLEDGATERTITQGDIYTIAPFNNALYVYEEDYEKLKEALDYTVKAANDTGLRISGVTAYYEGDQVNTIILDNEVIYHNGTWLKEKSTPIRLCTNQYVGTLGGTPFANWVPVETAKVDNESYMEVLKEEAEQSGGLLKVDTAANMIEGPYVFEKSTVKTLSLEAEEAAEISEFVLMTTTDMHGKCWYENILNNTSVNNSFLRVASAVKEAREEYGDRVVLIDCGDVYQGTPISSYNIQCGGEKNPMAICLKYIGYDASVLGNHEFNYSFETMQKIVKFMETDYKQEQPEVSPSVSPSVQPSVAPSETPSASPSVKPSASAVKKVTVALRANGGYFNTAKKPVVINKIVKVNSKYGVLSTPVRKGYTFAGWYTAKVNGTKIAASTVVKNAKDHAVYAHWNKVTVKKSAIVSIVNAKNKDVRVTVKKSDQAKGYQIMYSRDKAFGKGKTKTVTTKTLTATLKGLKKGQTYYFKVQVFKTDSTGAKVYSGWSSVKSKVTAK